MKHWTLLNQTPYFGDLKKDGKPGEYPFTRGLHESGYRERPWTIRQYSGFGTPEETNKRFKFLMEQGQTGLSLAFDLPTQMGFDSDHVRAKGEVGRVGVAIRTVSDMELVLKDIPLDKISLSMTINATAPILVAFFQVAGERRGVSPAQLMGTAQNDILKEYVARGTFIFPPRPSLRLATDLIVHCARVMPKFNPISVSGYHMRDAGCSIEQEMGFAIANGSAYIESALKQGVSIDEFAPRISWIFNTQNEFFAEVAKYRALRRIWARLLREKFGAKNPKSWQLRVHVQTGGSTLTAQQPENNIVRAAFQALSSVMGGVQSLALSCYDEAVAIPTEKSQTLAVRTQQMIAHETGVTEVVDPLGGAPYIEALTDELEKRALAIMAWVGQSGGAVEAIEKGLIQTAIDEASYRQQQEVERKEKIIVGVNQFQEKSEHFPGEVFKVNPATEKRAKASLAQFKKSRNQKKVEKALRELRNSAELSPQENLMPPLLEAVRRDATLGEMSDALRGVFGEYHPKRARI